MKKIKIAVGLSGGVDSSVSAYLLKQQGYDVIAFFMKNWEEDSCTAEEDYADVVKVCEILDIPFYTLNFTKEYKEQVFADFLEDYKRGITPNPDILCNQKIKFKAFYEKALSLGADKIATGHYAKIVYENGIPYLAQAKDDNKDQTYFLYRIDPDVLKDVIFPLSDLTKDEVKQIAYKANLHTFAKKESMGICFIGKKNFKPFLNQFIDFSPGNFETVEGEVIGTHDGAAFYTIGQRKGLMIGGPGKPWFVVDKDRQRNVVILAQGDDHPRLYHSKLFAQDPHFIYPVTFPLKAYARTRHRQELQECHIEKIDDGLHVSFTHPQRAITEGQSIVFYKDGLCLGGAMIEKRI